MKILIADDNPMAIKVLAHALEQEGHEIVICSNGREALEKLKSEDIRFVISDWEMPEMDGLALCEAVRGGGFPAYIYFILLTSHNESSHIVRGLGAGADDFITKPFDPGELKVRVRAGVRVLSLETRDLMIFALAKLAESRDTDTGAHLERVRNYTHALVMALAEQPDFAGQIDEEYAQLIYQTSPLHDIGKVAIPDAVLLKPGPLSEREFRLMQTHTTIGADTLDAALQQRPDAAFLRMARDIALSHHERWNGEGYPKHLRGEDIPLCGRVVALADVYDALTSRRVYKGSFTHERARSILVDESGEHFDPRVVDAFEKVEDRFIQIREQYLEPADMAMSDP